MYMYLNKDNFSNNSLILFKNFFATTLNSCSVMMLFSFFKDIPLFKENTQKQLKGNKQTKNTKHQLVPMNAFTLKIQRNLKRFIYLYCNSFSTLSGKGSGEI